MHDTPIARILIVDDEAAQMRALCDTLRDQGYDTVGFTSGLAAIDALRKDSFDLLLTDLMMPDLDGISLMRTVQQVDANLVCIIMTGQGTVATAVEAMRVGALDYILKPFKLSAILPVIARALTVKRLRMDNLALEKRVNERTAELEASNAELERARQAKDHFLAAVSHEFRTPLNAILGFTGVLLMKPSASPLSPDQERLLGIVQASGRHLLSLINDLLDLATIESGKVELDLEQIECQDVVKEVFASQHLLAAKKGLAFDLKLPDGAVTLCTDRRKLLQIVMNLVNNAIKYTAFGSVAVELSQYADEGHMLTHISVTDTGVGIRQEDQVKLFTAFAQVGDRRRPEDSTGLGLYLSAELSALIGGKIAFQSEYGSGSMFTLSVPSLKEI